ncbi:mannitol dehydrogenase family protein [Loktanella sp. TSTF-M6]|uniref:Mannitol dehydrogenase family protein n=1 Tax=Loktanella gaetbuli TaxID=2881335 RepID=A0ABS8BWC9_9RHOB|nr:mannitol dehydrogenase family protein [Loktanella gaetbuli]MCB5200051.1 mannitol dehydrogenase family protein [Loktanella gaetbuli]
MKDAQGHRAMKLSNATLADLPQAIVRPTYDRSALTPGIVHIGLGNFHRAHQAWYLHRLMQQGQAHDWAIIGAGVRPGDAAMRDRLLAQDCLNTLIELDPAGISAEVTGAMIDFLPIEEDNAQLIATMSDPAIRIVSLTVTEGGYYRRADGGLDTGHADLKHDAAHPATPRTAFGAMVAALRARRTAGHPPFTAMCCDNLQGNGAILRQTVVGLARLSDPDLADWIDTQGAFPDAMVDCIVPATGDAERSIVQDLGIDDAAPVTHENFRQWVIEDHFCAGRPDWAAAGATMTDNVHPYESMKIRILNAGHQVLANVGEIIGHQTIADCMDDPRIAAFFRKVQTTGIIPYVDAVDGMPAAQYLALIETRFANPRIRDTTRRVAFDGSSRHPGFVLPTLRDALAAGGDIQGLALTEALWARMCAGTREDGSQIAPNDPLWNSLVDAAQAARHDPQVWLAQDGFYGELGDNPLFADAFGNWLNQLWADGAAATIDAYLSR